MTTLQVGYPEPSFGTELVNGLGTCAEGSHVGSRAARIMRSLLEGNPDGKIAALGFVVRLPSGDRQEYFLNWWAPLKSASINSVGRFAMRSVADALTGSVMFPRCVDLLTNSLQYGSNWVVPAALLRFLCSWVDSSPAVAQALLEPQHYMSLFVGVLTGGVAVQDPTLISLTAFFLGACLVASSLTDMHTGWTP